MVLKRSVKRKRRNRRRRRSLQKGAGYSFKLDCNLPGGVSEVVTYKNCRTPQADLAPPADSQLAPLGQAQVEVVGVSNNNLAPVQQAQAQQTGGKRRRRRRRRRINLLRGGVQSVQGGIAGFKWTGPFGSANNEHLEQLIEIISATDKDELRDDILALQIASGNAALQYFNSRLTDLQGALDQIHETNESGDLPNNRFELYKTLIEANIEATEDARNKFLEDNPVQNGGRRSRRRRRRSNRKSRKSLRRRRRKTRTRRRRRRRRQSGGDFNCSNCNMATRTFGCKQPLWDAKCI